MDIHYRQPESDGGGAAPVDDLWAHGGAGSYILLPSATAAALEALYNTAGANFMVLLLWQADLALGDATVLRSFWGANKATKELVIFNGRDYAGGGQYRSAGVTDAGAPVYTHTGNGPVVVDGAVHSIQHADISSGGANGRAHCRVDSGSDVVLLAADYNRTSLGTIGRVSVGGEDRDTGVVPTLGWAYGAAVVNENLIGDGATIASAFAAALSAGGMRNGYAAWLAAIEAAVTDPATNILYAESYRQGSGADYGSDASRVGVTYTLPGVTP